MALPTASERGISPAPDVKLTHTITPQDVDKIAKVTGGIAENPGINARTYYGGHGREGGAQQIRYPELGAKLDFLGSPIAVVMDSPQASLEVDKNDISLNNSAVIIEEDSVTFVRRPEAETDDPFEPTANVSMVTITKDGISYQKTRVAGVRDENVLRAATMIDEEYRARAARRS